MKQKEKVTAGRRQPTFILFFCLSEAMPWCSGITSQNNVNILVYMLCSSFVQYWMIFLHFNMYPPQTLGMPYYWDVFCQKEYWAKIKKKVFGCEGFRVTSQVDFLIFPKTLNNAFCTSTTHLFIVFFFFSLRYSVVNILFFKNTGSKRICVMPFN